MLNECSEGLTIWLDSVGIAPCNKFIRVDYNADNHEIALMSFQKSLMVLSHLAPSLIVWGHFCRIIHDFENACIFMRLEPFNANGHRPVVSDHA